MKNDTQKFLETLKDPAQVKAKEAVINMLSLPSTRVCNIDFQEVSPGDIRFVVSIIAK